MFRASVQFVFLCVFVACGLQAYAAYKPTSSVTMQTLMYAAGSLASLVFIFVIDMGKVSTGYRQSAQLPLLTKSDLHAVIEYTDGRVNLWYAVILFLVTLSGGIGYAAYTGWSDRPVSLYPGLPGLALHYLFVVGIALPLCICLVIHGTVVHTWQTAREKARKMLKTAQYIDNAVAASMRRDETAAARRTRAALVAYQLCKVRKVWGNGAALPVDQW